MPATVRVLDPRLLGGVESVLPEKNEEGGELLKVYRAGDLAYREPTPWVVRHLLQKRGLSVVYGMPKTYKSFLVQSLLLDLAAGHATWMDNPVFSMDHPHPTRSVYFLAEGQDGLGQRIAGWCAAHGVDEDQVGELLVPVGSTPIYQDRMQPDNPKTWSPSQNRIYRSLKLLEPEVIAFDTLSRLTPGMDENSPQMAAVVGWLDLLRDDFGLSTIVAHHTDKKDLDLRGHSSLAGALSTSIHMDSVGEGLVQVDVRLQRDAEPFGKLPYRLEIVNDGDGTPSLARTSQVGEARPEGKQAEVLALLRLAGEPLSTQEIQEEVWPEQPQDGRHAARVLNDLRKRELVVSRDGPNRTVLWERVS